MGSLATPSTADEATAGGAFSDTLERWLESDDRKTLGAMGSVFAEKSFAVAILLLMFLPALPLPTGGVTHVFEGITIVLAAEMVIGRRMIWIPKRWERFELGASTTQKAIPFVLRRIRQVERFSRPRGTRLFDHKLATRVFGLVLMAFAIAAALAPPFSGLDTLPALGAVSIALAIILRDVALLGIGLVLGLTGIALILTVGAAVLRLVKSVF